MSKGCRAASSGRGSSDWTVSMGVVAIGSWMVGNPQCGEATDGVLELGASAGRSSSPSSGGCVVTVGDNAVEVDGVGVHGLKFIGGGYGAIFGVDCLSSCGTTRYWDRLKSPEEAVEKLLNENGNTGVPVLFS